MSKILEEARKRSELIFLEAKSNWGDDVAEFNVGYYSATGIKPDYKKAFDIFKKFAGKNVPEAFHNLGVMYLKGYGVAKNEDKAFEWFKKENEHGIK